MAVDFFAHYNQLENRVISVKASKKTTEHCIAVPITEEQATEILVNNVSLSEWVVGCTDDVWYFSKKKDLDVPMANVESGMRCVVKPNASPADVILQLSRDTAHIVGALDEPVHFFVADKNNPMILLAYLDFTAGVNAINTNEDYRKCIITMMRKNTKSYKLEIINE